MLCILGLGEGNPGMLCKIQARFAGGQLNVVMGAIGKSFGLKMRMPQKLRLQK
jgi:hypothetical protein